jgi:hypothetical protein
MEERKVELSRMGWLRERKESGRCGIVERRREWRSLVVVVVGEEVRRKEWSRRVEAVVVRRSRSREAGVDSLTFFLLFFLVWELG